MEKGARWLIESSTIIEMLLSGTKLAKPVAAALCHASAVAGVSSMASAEKLTGPQKEGTGRACGCCGLDWSRERSPWLCVTMYALTPGAKIDGKAGMCVVSLVCVECFHAHGEDGCLRRVSEFMAKNMDGEIKEIALPGRA